MKKNKTVAIIICVVMLALTFVPAAYALDTSGIESILGLFGFGDIDADDADGILSAFGNGSSVSLSDLLTGDGLDTIRGLLGGDANGASDSALSQAISSLLGGNSAISSDFLNEDFLGKLADYLAGENVTSATENTTGALITTEPATESETEPATTPVQESTTAPESTTAEPTTEEKTTVEATTREKTTRSSQSYSASTYTTVPVTETTSSYEYVPAVSETVTELVPTDFTPVVYDSDDGASDGVSAKMIIGIILLVLSGSAVIAVAVILKKNRV